MNVELVQHTPQPLTAIYTGYRVCYSRLAPSDIKIPVKETSMGDFNDTEKMGAFIKRLMALGHETPLEHAVFTFYIEGVSRALSHQLVRHRLASYNQQSQRYVDGANFNYVTPPAIKEAGLEGLYAKALQETSAYYEQLQQGLYKHYLKDKELDEKTCKTLANEDARFILPNATTTHLVMTVNARELRSILRLRMCEKAQWEIRDMAKQLLKETAKVMPIIGHNLMGCKTCKEKCKYAGRELR